MFREHFSCFADSKSSLADNAPTRTPEQLQRSPGSSGGAGTGAAADPCGEKGFMRAKKNVNDCLSGITDKKGKNTSRVNKGYFNPIENVI